MTIKRYYDKFEKIEKGRIESPLNNDPKTMSRFANILISGVIRGDYTYLLLYIVRLYKYI